MRIEEEELEDDWRFNHYGMVRNPYQLMKWNGFPVQLTIPMSENEPFFNTHQTPIEHDPIKREDIVSNSEPPKFG